MLSFRAVWSLPCACGDAHAFCEPGVPGDIFDSWITEIKQLPESLAICCQCLLSLQLAAFIVVFIKQSKKLCSQPTDWVEFHIASPCINETAD